MDRKLSPDSEIERLIRLSATSRACLTREVVAVKQRLDFPARIRGSLKGHPSAWLFGSLAFGFVGSLLFRRKPAVTGKKHRGWMMTLLGLALTAVRPFAKVWLADQVKLYLIKRPGALPDSHSRSNHPI